MDSLSFSDMGKEAERLMKVRLTVLIAALRNDKRMPFSDFVYDSTEGCSEEGHQDFRRWMVGRACWRRRRLRSRLIFLASPGPS